MANSSEWGMQVREDISAFCLEHRIVQKVKLRDMLGIPPNVWNPVSQGDSISTDVSAYAQLYRIGITSADPRTIPPKNMYVRGEGTRERPRAWTDEQFKKWLAKQPPLHPTLAQIVSGQSQSQPPQMNYPVFQQDVQPTPVAESETVPPRDEPQPYPQQGTSSQPSTQTSAMPTIGQQIDSWIGGIATAAMPHLIGPVFGVLNSQNSLFSDMTARIRAVEEQLAGMTRLLGEMKEEQEVPKRQQTAGVESPSLEEHFEDLDSALRVTIEKLRAASDGDSKELHRKHFGQLHELSKILAKVTSSQKKDTPGIEELAKQFQGELERLLNGNPEARSRVLRNPKFKELLGEIWTGAELLAKSNEDQLEDAIKLKKELNPDE